MKLEQNFYLDGNDEFSNRQKNIFGELDRLGSSQPENRYVQGENEFRPRRAVVASSRTQTRQFSGQESLFKIKPYPMKQRSAGTNLNFVPDFVKHPTKWKKYHLGDEVMSDKSNQAAAMSFLKELRSRKQDDDASGPSTSSRRIVFNRHATPEDSTKSADKVDPVEKPTFIDGKLVMPEYVVGAKQNKNRTPKKFGNIAAGTAVKLGHLDEEEYDCE